MMFRTSFSRLLLGLGTAALLLPACQSAPDKAARLPYLGEPDVIAPGDTLYPRIPSFSLTNQDSATVTPATFAGKVYVADFFFTTCPSICPKMSGEMLRVYEKYQNDPRVSFVSHTIDPEHDTLPVLRDYAQRLGVKNAQQWHFVTAPRDTIYRLAGRYMAAVERDKTAPGGAVHNGAFALVDSQGHVRGLYDGINPQEVDRLIKDLPVLLAELDNSTTKATAKD